MRKSFIYCAFVIAMSCSDDNDATQFADCTDDLRAGLSVQVIDAATNDAINGATLLAFDGSEMVPLEQFGDTGNYVGAHERPGEYTITVRKDGYESVVTDKILVEEDECHVITENVLVEMIAN